MVLEKTVTSRDIEKYVVEAFGNNSISLVFANNTIVLTPVLAKRNVSELAMLSENTLAKDWLLPEEDKAWEFL